MGDNDFDKQVIREDPASAVEVAQAEEKRAEKATDDMQRADDAARLEFARRVFKHKRKPEGELDLERMILTPSVRENLGKPEPANAYLTGIAAPRSRFVSWSHVYKLCMRACDGKEVPLDIAEKFATLYPKINERHMRNAVDVRLLKESQEHDRAQRADAKATKLAASKTRDARRAKREKQLAGLEAKLKKVKQHEALLLTRMKRVRASIRMLSR